MRALVAALPEQPVIDSAIAQRLIGRSHVAVNNALRQQNFDESVRSSLGVS